MQQESFRITDPTLAILAQDGRDTPVTVPAGSIIVADQAALTGNHLIDVLWNGQHILMFSLDLRTRAELLTTRRN
jgi:hypothetical protein